MPLVEHKLGRLTKSHETDVCPLFADLTRLKQTCNKTFPQTKQPYLQQHKQHCHYLPDNTASDRGREHYGNELIHPPWLCEKTLHFSVTLWAFYWSTKRFHQIMMKHLCCLSCIPNVKFGFCQSQIINHYQSHYLNLSFCETDRYGPKMILLLLFRDWSLIARTPHG